MAGMSVLSVLVMTWNVWLSSCCSRLSPMNVKIDIAWCKMYSYKTS